MLGVFRTILPVAARRMRKLWIALALRCVARYKTLSRAGQLSLSRAPCRFAFRGSRNTCLRATYDVEYSKSDPPSRIKSRSRLRLGLFATKRRHTYVIAAGVRKCLSFARAHTAEWISSALGILDLALAWILNIKRGLYMCTPEEDAYVAQRDSHVRRLCR